MKNFFKSIFGAIGFCILGYLHYILLMLLISWMMNWWWFFIILYGLTIISTFSILNGIVGIFVYLANKNIIGKILSVLFAIYLTYFSIHSLWIDSEYGDVDTIKKITIQIMSTVNFAITYIMTAFFILTYSEK